MLQTSANSLQVRRLQVQQQQFFPFFVYLFIFLLTSSTHATQRGCSSDRLGEEKVRECSNNPQSLEHTG